MLINNRHIFLLVVLAIVISSLSCVSADDAIANDTFENSGISQNFNLQTDDAFYASAPDFDLSKSDDDVLADGIVYFDASAAGDGDGSRSSPYKYLTDDRLPRGVTAHFASGVYEVDEELNLYSGSGSQVTFIGDGMRNTVIKSLNYDDFYIGSGSTFYACNLTFEGSHILNHGIFGAENVIFKNSIDQDSYDVTPDYSDYISSDSYGGAIFSGGSSDPSNYFLSLEGCYFINNKAISGGAIAVYNSAAFISKCIFYNSSAPRLGGAIHSAKSRVLISQSIFETSYASHGGSIYANIAEIEITDSAFDDSRSYGFGGAIACENTYLDIDSSNFTWSSSSVDSGGAVYMHFSHSDITDSLFFGNSAIYGGAISSMKSDLNVSRCDFSDNCAAYGGDAYVAYGQNSFEHSCFYNSYAYYGSSICASLIGTLTLNYNDFINSTPAQVAVQGSADGLIENGNTADGASIAVEVYDGHVFNLYSDDVASQVSIVPESQTSIPSRYDLRDYGYVTPVKNQKTGGNCWSFAGISALESCLKKATGITFDFSEENAKNLMTEYSVFGVKGETNVDGGTGLMLMSYLASWLGPIYESEDVYDEYSQLALVYSPLFHIQNIYWVPDRADFLDNDNFKRAIMDYGAVVISFDTDESAHAVCLVGWDDDYRGYDYFNDTCTMGAWIFKNSWGSEWNDGGFAYLSYEHILNSENYSNNYAYTFIFNDTNCYDRIYQYDFGGMIDWYPEIVYNIPVHYMNRFEAVEDGWLSAVSTYFENSTDFVISIYKGDSLELTQEGHCEMGYYTIPLNSKILLNKGDAFSVEFKLLSDFISIPLCNASELNWPTFTRGVSFYRYDDEEYWTDTYPDGVLCIKAFTTPLELVKTAISVNQFTSASIGEEVIINADFDDGAGSADGSLVTVLINGRPYYAVVENGSASLKMVFDSKGTYDLSAYYKNNIYESNVVSFTFEVNDDLVISAPDVEMYYGGPQKYNVYLTRNNAPVSAVVEISLNGKTHTVSTNSSGQAVLDLDLPVGTYVVTLTAANASRSSKVTVKSTVYAEDCQGTYLDAEVSSTFLDSKGDVLKNAGVIFRVGNQDFTSTTDAHGHASADINLNVGKYDVIVVNPVSGEQKKISLDISKADSAVSLSSSQTGNVVNVTAGLPLQATGKVIFNINLQDYPVNVTGGAASLMLEGLPSGTYEVTAAYSGDGNFNANSAKKTVTVKNDIVLTADDVIQYYGESKSFTAVLTQNGVPLADVYVNIAVGGADRNVKTDSQGRASVVIDNDVGDYDAVSSYGNVSVSNRITVKSTIAAYDSVGEYSKASVSATVLDSKGNPAKGSVVRFIASGREFEATADSKGFASALIGLSPGTYNVTVSNTASGEKRQIRLVIEKASSSISLSGSQRGKVLILTAELSSPLATGEVLFNINLRDYHVNVDNGVAGLEISNLEAGTYDVTAAYSGDGNFYGSSAEKSVTVKSEVVLSASDVVQYYGGLKTFDVTVTQDGLPLANVNVSITIAGDEWIGETDSRGIASVLIYNEVGTYDVVSRYEDKSISNMITVKSTISAEDCLCQYSNAKVGAAFLDSNGNAEKYREVKFFIGSQEFIATTDANGYAAADISLNAGTYDVRVFNTETYESKQIRLTIAKAFSITDLTVVQNGNVITLTSSVAPDAATGNVTFAVGSRTYAAKIKNGNAAATVSDLTSGTYSIIAYYGGDGNFQPSQSESASFKFERINAVIDAGDVRKYQADPEKLTFTLKDSKGNAIANVNVNVVLNGVSKTLKTDGSGRASMDIDLDLGNYAASIAFDGAGKYDAVSKTIRITVEKKVLELTANSVSTVYGTVKYLVVNLKDSNGNQVSGAKISFDLDGLRYGYYGDDYTDENGQIKISSKDVLPDSYTVSISAEDCRQIKTKLTVTKATPKIAASKKTFKVKTKIKKYTITLKNNLGKVMKNAKVTIKVNKKTYTAKTNSKGKATFKITKLAKKGKYTAVVKYAGNTYYKAVNKKVTITVKN